jgi:hypothetical protein
MTTEIEKAEAVLADLDHAMLRLKARGVELGDERQSIALAAHTGDASARKKLDALNREIAVHGSELDSLHVAVEAQEKVVAQAKAQEQSTVAREAALKAKAQYQRLAAIGQKMDEHLAAFAALAEQSRLVVNELHGLNFAMPTHAQHATFSSLATGSTLMALPWATTAEYRHLAPRDRRSFSTLYGDWSRAAIDLIDQHQREPADAA